MKEVKEQLIHSCNYLEERELVQLKSAMDFAEKAHVGQTRATGEPYIIHPFEVCLILSEYKADITTLVCSLLHDVVEDTTVNLKEIELLFGKDVAFIVDGLTKFEKGTFEKEEYSAINMEKLLSYAIQDIRIAAIKLADRLHNMRTLAIKRTEKKIPYSNETLLYFSPLAERIGLFTLQRELEELAFSYLHPERYKQFREKINNYTKVYEESYEEFITKLMKEDTSHIITKHRWINIPLFQGYNLLSEGFYLSDMFTVHITIDSTFNCYTALGLVHSTFETMPDHFVDQIAIEKHPFIKQLKTKVRVAGIPMTIVLQDRQTQYFYQNGIFACLKTIDSTTLSTSLLGNSIPFAKSITNNPIAFCELVSLELFYKEIEIYTPKMDIIKLPINSNIIDFAYALNPNLANKLAFAKVNGKISSLQTILKDKDIVELHVKNKITANAKWLHFVKTSKAVKEITDIVNDETNPA
ncbi:HD domain-containing protein [Psychrobacillus sp. MER TA 171]|uniref:HD domain-containing protein n=1 Tax=Psychrobacillus sp. MER TA 171 TaxID=2939577 RepID=UPI00203FEB63|nr:HD domain-containing protein [Psychrobacillus sp. MER TA 171]MCM3357356.1 HD domain-containing protein [Psychrobacillus sp. MER TA 171]